MMKVSVYSACEQQAKICLKNPRGYAIIRAGKPDRALANNYKFIFPWKFLKACK